MIVAKMAHPCRGVTTLCRPWTKHEEGILRRRYRAAAGVDGLAAELGRTPRAILARARKLKIYRAPRRWSDIEDRRLMLALEEVGLAWAARRLGRTPRAVHQRALRIGIPLGRPPGYESISAAAARTGFAFETVERILGWAGVKTRHALAQPSATRAPRRLQRMVETFDVDEAIEAWLSTETPYAAARRLGCSEERLVKALLRSCLPLPARPGQGKHWRIPSETIDRAMSARKNPDLGSTAQGAAGVFPGANARRDAAAMSISGRRTPSGIDRHRGGILRDTKKHWRIKAEGLTRGRDLDQQEESAF
jgi:hypothetical protein